MALAIQKLEADAQAQSPSYRLIPAADAARIMGIAERHLRRRCAEEFAPRGLAAMEDGKWHVSPLVDDRLPRELDALSVDRELVAELYKDGTPQNYIDAAIAKRDILLGFNRFEARGMKEADARAAYIASLEARGVFADADLTTPDVRTFYRWEAAYRQQHIAGLCRKVYARHKAGPVGEAAMEMLMNLVNCGNKFSASEAIELTRGKAAKHPDNPAWKMPADRTIQLELQRRRPPALKTFINKGDSACTKLHMPKRRRNYESIAANEEWVGDERTMDVCIRYCGSRGWKATRVVTLTVWMDMRSRVIVGWEISLRGSSRTILAAFKRGVLVYGKPRIARCDWGKDYVKALGNSRKKRRRDDPAGTPRRTYVMEQLGIDVQPTARPYMPWAKPVEPFFSVMKTHFDRFWDSFMGGSPTERHEDRGDWIKANLERLPTIHDLIAAFEQWLDNYHNRPHGAADLFGKTPLEAMQAFRDGPARTETPAVLDHLFAFFSEPRTVGRDGIRFRNGIYGFCEPSLIPLQGQQVLLRYQPDNIGDNVIVCDLNRMPLSTVPPIKCERWQDYSEEDAKRQARLHRETVKPYRKMRRGSRDYFDGLTTKQRFELQREGIEAVHGDRRIQSLSPVPQLRVRPDLEAAIDAIPEKVEKRSKAVRSGTANRELNVHDMAEADVAPPPAERHFGGLSLEDFLED
ncbi:MAG: transposase [Phycisphaerae bacterium]|nr:transposase [Phycisphaerae bacterium]